MVKFFFCFVYLLCGADYASHEWKISKTNGAEYEFFQGFFDTTLWPASFLDKILHKIEPHPIPTPSEGRE